MQTFLTYLKHPQWRTQQIWRRAIWRTMGSIGLTGLHALPLNRRWVEIHRRSMPLANLDPAFAGLRIVQLSDLHHSPVVSMRYLVQYVRWVNDLEPDLVVVTGDLITGGYRYAHRVAAILSHLHAPRGVICTFGNHDYGISGRHNHAEGDRRADFLQKCLADRGMIVLRNSALVLRAPQAARPLAIVGLDDDWSGHINPGRAFAKIDPSWPAICLNHNPANCLELMGYSWQWMLAGHTHGRQLAAGRIGRRLYPGRYRHYTHGYYRLADRHLYVNRGLSYGQRLLNWCRPEITVFKLQPLKPRPALNPATIPNVAHPPPAVSADKRPNVTHPPPAVSADTALRATHQQ